MKSDVLVLFGQSGAGKSLTLEAITGILRPDRGRIVLDRERFFDSRVDLFHPLWERRIGYVPQNYALFPHLTVRDNIG